MRICSADWLGLMAVEPRAARMLLRMWKSGGDAAIVRAGIAARSAPPTFDELTAIYARAAGEVVAFTEDQPRPATAASKPYQMAPDGVAVISMRGVMMKDDPGKFDGAAVSTKRVRMALAEAEADPAVKGIVLRVDSPGGYTSGTDELGQAIAKAAKPVVVAVEDCCASAAYWAASAARGGILINRMGLVGSLGVFTVLMDESGALEAEGIKVHLVSTGGIKGHGVQGVNVSEELIAEYQGMVNRSGAAFKAAVKAGRKGVMSPAAVEKAFTGQMFAAEDAVSMGLVDGIGGIEEAVKRAAKLAKSGGVAGGGAGGGKDRQRAELVLGMGMARAAAEGAI